MKFLRGWVLRAPHLLVLIQNVSWEASIQDPGEDGWGCPTRSCLLGLGHFIPISHSCSSSDLKVGQTHPREEADNTCLMYLVGAGRGWPLTSPF